MPMRYYSAFPPQPMPQQPRLIYPNFQPAQPTQMPPPLFTPRPVPGAYAYTSSSSSFPASTSPRGAPAMPPTIIYQSSGSDLTTAPPPPPPPQPVSAQPNPSYSFFIAPPPPQPRLQQQSSGVLPPLVRPAPISFMPYQPALVPRYVPVYEAERYVARTAATAPGTRARSRSAPPDNSFRQLNASSFSAPNAPQMDVSEVGKERSMQSEPGPQVNQSRPAEALAPPNTARLPSQQQPQADPTRPRYFSLGPAPKTPYYQDYYSAAQVAFPTNQANPPQPKEFYTMLAQAGPATIRPAAPLVMSATAPGPGRVPRAISPPVTAPLLTAGPQTMPNPSKAQPIQQTQTQSVVESSAPSQPNPAPAQPQPNDKRQDDRRRIQEENWQLREAVVLLRLQMKQMQEEVANLRNVVAGRVPSGGGAMMSPPVPEIKIPRYTGDGSRPFPQPRMQGSPVSSPHQ